MKHRYVILRLRMKVNIYSQRYHECLKKRYFIRRGNSISKVISGLVTFPSRVSSRHLQRETGAKFIAEVWVRTFAAFKASAVDISRPSSKSCYAFTMASEQLVQKSGNLRRSIISILPQVEFVSL